MNSLPTLVCSSAARREFVIALDTGRLFERGDGCGECRLDIADTLRCSGVICFRREVVATYRHA